MTFSLVHSHSALTVLAHLIESLQLRKNQRSYITYEVRTLLELGMSHRMSNTDTYDYIKLCYFLKLLSVSAYQCSRHV
jgi:hypothetical protein